MMPSTASRDDWALALARFTNCLRPDWDVPGIRAAIHQARSLAVREDIAVALIELTKRDDLRTPALLREDGPHWHTGRTPDTRVEPVRCPRHEHEIAASCRACPVEDFDPTGAPTLAIHPDQAARNAAGAARVLAALEQARTTPPARAARVDNGMED